MTSRAFPFIGEGTPARGMLVARTGAYFPVLDGPLQLLSSPVVLNPCLNAGRFFAEGLGVIDRVLGRSPSGELLVQVILSGEAAVLNHGAVPRSITDSLAYSLALGGLAPFASATAGIVLGSFLGMIEGSANTLVGIELDPVLLDVGVMAKTFPLDLSRGDPTVGTIVATSATDTSTGPALDPNVDIATGFIAATVETKIAIHVTVINAVPGLGFSCAVDPTTPMSGWRAGQAIGFTEDGLLTVDPFTGPSTIVRQLAYLTTRGVPVWWPVLLPSAE